MRDLLSYLEDGIGVEDGTNLRVNPLQHGGDAVPHCDGAGKDESESENLTEQGEQYKGPIMHSREKLVNLII